MDPNNQPTVTPPAEAGGEPLPPAPFVRLVDWLGLHPKSVGKPLVDANLAVGWEEVLKVSPAIPAELAETDNQVKQRMGGCADSIQKRYFLVVHSRRVKVLHGFKPCRLLTASGSRHAGFRGDRKIGAGGLEIAPMLVTAGRAVGDQLKRFEVKEAKAKPFQDAVEKLANAPNKLASQERRVWQQLYGSMSASVVQSIITVLQSLMWKDFRGHLKYSVA